MTDKWVRGLVVGLALALVAGCCPDGRCPFAKRDNQCDQSSACDTACPKASKKAACKGDAAQCPFVDKQHAPCGKGWVKLTKSMDQWESFPADRTNSWSIEDGILASKPVDGHGTNIYTKKRFKDFELYYEFRLPPNGNSGVFLRGLYEQQIKDDLNIENWPQDADWGSGGIYNKVTPSKRMSKPAGEWNAGYVRFVGDTINIWMNGEQVVTDYKISGPTHLYNEMKDVKEGEAGPLLLQGDHSAVEYRNVCIKPVK